MVLGVLGTEARAENASAPYSYSQRPHTKAVLTKKVEESNYHLLLAEFELRPSWNSDEGHFFSINYGELGFRPSENVSLSYQQMFMTEISNYSSTSREPVRLFDGYLRLKANKLWQNDRHDTFFSYEARAYAPTDKGKRDSGMVTAVRNYLKLMRQITGSVSFLFMDVPIAHFYNTAGTSTASSSGPKFTANPLFENQVYLELDVNPVKSGWSISFPIMFSSTRFRDYDTRADNSGAWTQWLEIYPEIDYSIAKSTVLGVAYESGNILNVQTDYVSSANPAVGSGTLQLVLRSSF